MATKCIFLLSIIGLCAACVESPFADRTYRCREGMGAVDCVSDYACVYMPGEGSDWWCVKSSDSFTREDTTSGTISGDTSGTISGDTSGTTSGDTSDTTCTINCSAGCGFDDGCEGVCGCEGNLTCINHQCVEPNEACIRIDKSEHTLHPPAGLRVVFRVSDCDGYPVRKLTSEDIDVVNDATGQPFGGGAQSGGASPPSIPPDYGLYTMLALDMSDSASNAGALDQILNAAQLFVQRTVEQAPTGLKPHVGLIVFGRTAQTQVLQNFTSDHVLLQQQIESLRAGQSLGVSNLYGAYMMALQAVLAEGTQHSLVERAVVILTAGTHQAGDEVNLRAQALSAKRAGELDGSLTVFSVAIRGGYDESKVRELATLPDYAQITEDASGLSAALDALAMKTQVIAERNYAVAVCTPVELGNASLTLKVRVGEAMTEQQISYNADDPSKDLTGDVTSCDLSIITDPCGERVCGPGVLPESQCGSCSGIREICNDIGQCEDDCLGLTCGPSPVLRQSCGVCDGTTYCEANQCVDDCMNRECGTSPRGFNCGTCLGSTACSGGQCINDCGVRVCGVSHLGISCGTCAGVSEYCSNGQCVDDCLGRVCGLAPSLGLSCGVCSESTFCNSNSQCTTAPATGTRQVFGASGAYRFIRPGTFMMGSPTNELGHISYEIQHQVTLTRGFWLKETEVTQGEWQAVMLNNPSLFTLCGSNCPVERVSWWDAVAYCNALSSLHGLTPCYTLTNCVGTPGGVGYQCPGGAAYVENCTGYRLPTEAEWEYAYRAGSTTAFYNGANTLGNYSCTQEPNLSAIGWYCANSGVSYSGCSNLSSDGGSICAGTHTVGGKLANNFGLFDMSGNVWEWTWDWSENYSSTPQIDPVGPSDGSSRAVRGASWNWGAINCRAASRNGYPPTNAPEWVGFRPVRSF